MPGEPQSAWFLYKFTRTKTTLNIKAKNQVECKNAFLTLKAQFPKKLRLMNPWLPTFEALWGTSEVGIGT